MSADCDTGTFDRTICPEPCGKMHSYCDTCRERQDPCAHEAGLVPPADIEDLTKQAAVVLALVAEEVKGL